MATGGGGTSSLIRDDLNRQARPLQQKLPQNVGSTQTSELLQTSELITPTIAELIEQAAEDDRDRQTLRRLSN